MHRVTLLFKTEKDMREFYEVIRARNAEINTRTFTMLCDCHEREVELAINAFGATVIRREQLS